MRNIPATLLLSQGTPMLVAGDEFGRTQRGDNNAYCQDNEISWVDWDIQEEGCVSMRFVKRLAAIRHRYPILRRNLFLNGQYIEELGVKDVTWIHPGGAEMDEQQWGDAVSRCFGMFLDGRAQTTGIRQRGKEATLLVIFNGHFEPVPFKLPGCAGTCRWSLLIDTNCEEEASGYFAKSAPNTPPRNGRS